MVESFVYAATTAYTAYKMKQSMDDGASGIHGSNEKVKHPADGMKSSRGNGSDDLGNNENFNNNRNNLNDFISAFELTMGFVGLAIVTNLEKQKLSESKTETEESESEFESVVGKHLKETDPDYWNRDDMTDDQRDNYERNRQNKWEEYQREKVSNGDERSDKEEN